MCFRFSVLVGSLAILAAGDRVLSAEDAVEAPRLALRVETLTVPPSTRPLVHVAVRNMEDTPYAGRISLSGPEGWRISPAEREVSIERGQTIVIPFSIEQARNAKSNEYEFIVRAADGSSTVVHRQTTFVASAPYFKPTIDGNPDDWQDAIPITFSTQDQKTVVRTFWNRRRFAMLIAVQEKQLHRADEPFQSACDAIQFALSALEEDGATPTETAGRFEFLLMATDDGGVCFQLADLDTPLQDIRQNRALLPLKMEDAELAIKRIGDLTYYECSLPFSAMRSGLRPSEGREFLMSVLIHDPDGTGIRDLGEAAGLWQQATDSTGWCNWPGAKFSESPPRAPRVRWGFCTSKY